jgi:hypothetical protein
MPASLSPACSSQQCARCPAANRFLLGFSRSLASDFSYFAAAPSRARLGELLTITKTNVGLYAKKF